MAFLKTKAMKDKVAMTTKSSMKVNPRPRGPDPVRKSGLWDDLGCEFAFVAGWKIPGDGEASKLKRFIINPPLFIIHPSSLPFSPVSKAKAVTEPSVPKPRADHAPPFHLATRGVGVGQHIRGGV